MDNKKTDRVRAASNQHNESCPYQTREMEKSEFWQYEAVAATAEIMHLREEVTRLKKALENIRTFVDDIVEIE